MGNSAPKKNRHRGVGRGETKKNDPKFNVLSAAQVFPPVPEDSGGGDGSPQNHTIRRNSARRHGGRDQVDLLEGGFAFQEEGKGFGEICQERTNPLGKKSLAHRHNHGGQNQRYGLCAVPPVGLGRRGGIEDVGEGTTGSKAKHTRVPGESLFGDGLGNATNCTRDAKKLFKNWQYDGEKGQPAGGIAFPTR